MTIDAARAEAEKLLKDWDDIDQCGDVHTRPGIVIAPHLLRALLGYLPRTVSS